MPHVLQRRVPYTLERRVGAVAIPGAVGAPALVAPTSPRLLVSDPITLFDRIVITDTLSHRPTKLLAIGQARMFAGWVLEIDNQLDQALTADLIGSMFDDPANAGDIGLSSTIGAGTFQPIINDTWVPFLGIRLTAAVAPTTGFVTVRGVVQQQE